ncbi:MAG: DUF1932 domain-containing protein [Desulfofustis sp.]|nr:DUF1932 domain-containing protein [Desulfofustis sp.]
MEKLGFIGFGGAGYGLSKGLRESGQIDITFFDLMRNDESVGPVLSRRADETGARSCSSVAELIDSAGIIISCVPGAFALKVAEEAALHLKSHHLFVDVNTTSPKTMGLVYEALRESGSTFVDVAMMGAVPAFLHRVPCLASGTGAQMFKSCMEPYGMDITWVGEEPGQATAIKMLRSVFMKGLLALLIETLGATHRYGVDKIVLESLARTMAKNDFLGIVRQQLAKGVISAERMTHEMEAVVQTLVEMGAPATMSAATRVTLRRCSDLGLAEHFNHEMPDSLEEILDALTAEVGK